MNNKSQILELYYSEHLKVKEISAILNVSSPYISKIIKDDIRYTDEKSNRTLISKENRKKYMNKYIKDKNYKKRIEENFQAVIAQHNSDVKCLSNFSHLSNENYRKWNTSAYKYNISKRRYEFDSNLGRAADVPKYIKER